MKKLYFGYAGNYFSFLKNSGIAAALLFLFSINSAMGQGIVSGKILDDAGEALEGAVVTLEEARLQTLTDENGVYSFEKAPPGAYKLTVSFLGFETKSTEIELSSETASSPVEVNFSLAPDPLELSSVIVTGTFDERSKLESSVAITTLSEREMALRATRGAADLLKAIPGIYADASAGEVFTRVYSRGISASAEDDIGWFYESLQEDGLPVNATQHVYYSPDLFYRADLTVKRLEAIRGGIASITNNNAPGGIFNFISKTGGPDYKGELALTGALEGDGNAYFRVDGDFGGPISGKGWTYNLGGFYRFDEGARNIDFNWSSGGQLKFNVVKTHRSGYLKFYGKYLNDKTNRWTGLAAKNWKDPKAAFGQDFNTTALLLPKLKTTIADGRFVRNDPSRSLTFNTADGVRAKDVALGFDFSQSFGKGWRFRNNAKFSDKSANWQTSIANQPLGLESFLPYFLSGFDSPWGAVVFRNAKTGETLATVNNLGALNAFAGEVPTFEYINGSLPNDALMGIAPWQKVDEATEFVDQVSLAKTFGSHETTAGAFFALSDVATFTQASFAYATYEPNPRMLQVTLENPGAPVIQLSDPAGIANYAGLFFNKGEATVTQFATFLNDVWKVTDQLNLDLGLRYELVRHDGEKDRSEPISREGGLDGKEETAFDNAVLAATGAKDGFDFTYDYLSFSAGANYRFNDKTALFGRFTSGHKAPELNYYFDKFPNLPVDVKGTVQDILQVELGFKFKTDPFAFFSTAFWSRLNDINFSEFVFDQNGGGGLFFTPPQFNQTTSIGLELEAILSPFQNFNLHLLTTLQKTDATTFTVYDANGTVDVADDKVNDFSGNDLPHNPKIAFEMTPSYKLDKLEIFFTWRFTGEREANVANAFQLPSFSLFNAGVTLAANKTWNISLLANNLFNSEGLMNFLGPNEFGSNANAATKDFIAQNPDATFVVFPVAPRTVQLRADFRF